MKPINYQRGVTLVEVIIASALVVTIMVIVVALTISLYKAVPDYQVMRELARGGSSAFGRLGYEIRGATSVVTSSSTLGATSSVLVLAGETETGTPYTTTFKLAGGQLLIRRDNESFQSLMSGRLWVNSFTAYRLTTNQSEAVYVKLNLSASTTGRVINQTIENTNILRGSYVE